MKRTLKVFFGIMLCLTVVFSLIQLYRLIKKHDAKAILLGLIQARQSEGLVDITGVGSRFAAQKKASNEHQLEALMASKGYMPVGRFGRSILYAGAFDEIVVKQIDLFNRYTIFEIYNESYFENQLAA